MLSRSMLVCFGYGTPFFLFFGIWGLLDFMIYRHFNSHLCTARWALSIRILDRPGEFRI